MSTELSYVRTEMLAEKAPPASSIGFVGWLRKNLFSNIPNTIITLLAIYFVYRILAQAIPWIFVPTWQGTSVNDCRDILAEAEIYRDHGAACWGVIRERWQQLLFGFYPKELYWRPILAFIGLFVALGPILFSDKFPRKMLWFSAAYPFLMVWLLWGGSIWQPISAALGFGIGWVLFRATLDHAGALVANTLLILGPIVWWLAFASGFGNLMHSILPIGLEFIASDKFGGFMLSIFLGVSGIALSFPLGLLLALGRQSDLILLKSVCVVFIEFIRGVPLITLLFVASTLLNIFLPPGTNFDIVLRVVIMVTLFAAAYMAEVIRGGLAALPKGQYEAADSLGLDYAQATRLIILPQALKISIPGIVSTFIGLFKDTTLVSIISLFDPIGLKNTINAAPGAAWSGVNWELYGVIAVVFFIFCFSMSRYSMYLERKLATDHR